VLYSHVSFFYLGPTITRFPDNPPFPRPGFEHLLFLDFFYVRSFNPPSWRLSVLCDVFPYFRRVPHNSLFLSSNKSCFSRLCPTRDCRAGSPCFFFFFFSFQVLRPFQPSLPSELPLTEKLLFVFLPPVPLFFFVTIPFFPGASPAFDHDTGISVSQSFLGGSHLRNGSTRPQWFFPPARFSCWTPPRQKSFFEQRNTPAHLLLSSSPLGVAQSPPPFFMVIPSVLEVSHPCFLPARHGLGLTSCNRDSPVCF